jgi:hypothetical protein
MTKKSMFFVAVGFFFLTALIIMKNSPKPSSYSKGTIAEESSSVEETPIESTAASANVVDTRVVDPLPVQKKTFTELFQNLKVVDTETARQDVEKNPHATPPSVLRSALSIGYLYDAISSEEEAGKFLEKMADCSARDADVPTSLKASCLTYARRTGARFPQYKDKAETLLEASTPQAVEIEKLSRRTQ